MPPESVPEVQPPARKRRPPAKGQIESKSLTEDEAARLGAGIEAVLLTVDKPVPGLRLAEALGQTENPLRIEAAVSALNASYSQTGRSFRVEHVAGGFRILTLPEFAPIVAAFHKARASNRLSKAAVETLAIVAYRQPVTRAQLEAIRGVACGEVLKSLLDRRLVTIKGRAEELGRPILYGTTKEFLDTFGLDSLKSLPSAAELAPPG
jgi:segregation and condensation protein B